MCGVPVHRADEYLQRLIKLGYRVAVCEQLEDPAEARKRGAKAVVRRDVVRLVTPGTLTEDTLLDAKARNYLTALFRAPAAEGRSAAGDARGARLARHLDGRVRDRRGAGRRTSPGELVRLAPGRSARSPTRLLADAERHGAGSSVPARRATPVPAASFDSLAGERDSEGAARRRRSRRPSAASRAPSWPRSARCCATSI